MEAPNSNFEGQEHGPIQITQQETQRDDEDVAISLEDIAFSTQVEKKMESSNLNVGDRMMDEDHVKVNDKSNDAKGVNDDDDFLRDVFDELIEEDQQNLLNKSNDAKGVNDVEDEMNDEDQQNLHDNALAIIDELPEVQEELSTDMTSIFTIAKVFDSHEAVTKHLKALARENGIVIVKKRSNMIGKRTHFILFQCERSDKPRGKYEKKVGGTGKKKPRQSSTRKCNCPFLLKSIKDKFTGVWNVRVVNGMHNHKTFKYDEGHAYLGRIDKEEVEVVATMTRSGIAPRNILKMLRAKDKNNCTTPKTVYNIRAKLSKEQREGRTVMQEVFKLSDKSGCFVECRFDESNVVKDIFWAYKEGLSLAKCFPSVMLMDCTYKTNKYKMPLLQIVGVTSTDMSFSVGFALLHFEKEDNYAWALNMLRKAIGDQSDRVCCIVTDREEALMNSIRVVFPKARNLLCLWHIEKGLVSNLKTKSTSDEWEDLLKAWNEVVRSNSEEEMKERLEEFNVVFGKRAKDYVCNTWLNSHKEAFVCAWTNTVFHLGNTSTSRVEGMHAVLKNWLRTGLGDVVAAWEGGLSLIDQEMRNIKKSFETCLFMEPMKFKDNEMFKELKFHVSIFALDLLYEELGKTDDSDALNKDCRCTICMTHGLPCRHQLARFKKNPGYIPLSSIHVHWKTLDIKGPPPKESELDYVPVLTALEEKLKMSNAWERQRLISKIREICEPSVTVLQEPKMKKTGRGRPKGSSNKKRKLSEDASTKREKSMFEHVEDAISSVKEVIASAPTPPSSHEVGSAKKQKTVTTRSQSKAKAKVPKFETSSSSTVVYIKRYLKHFPPNVHEHITSIVNVDADGNCGYRVIAHGIGLQDSEWPVVRKALLHELLSDKDHYMTLFGEQDVLYNKCVDCVMHEAGPCGVDKYFDSYLGWVVCNTYGVSVSIVSTTHGNQTFLPSKKKPSVWPAHHIWMGFCGGNHFMRLFMKDTCPMPRVSTKWHNCRTLEANEWYEKYEHRISLWRNVIKDHWAEMGNEIDPVKLPD